MNIDNNQHFLDVDTFVQRALEKDGSLIKYIANPSIELQMISCKNTVTALRFIEKPDKSVLDLVINKYESGVKTLSKIRNPDVDDVLDMLYNNESGSDF